MWSKSHYSDGSGCGLLKFSNTNIYSQRYFYVYIRIPTWIICALYPRDSAADLGIYINMSTAHMQSFNFSIFKHISIYRYNVLTSCKRIVGFTRTLKCNKRLVNSVRKWNQSYGKQP